MSITQVTPALITNPLRKNAIINGEFNVWQRGTSFVSIATAAYSADRWMYEKVGAMVHDVSRSTDVPTVAQAGRLYNYSMLVDCQTVDTSIAAGDFCCVEQRVEGYNFLPLAQIPFVLSFWVKATKTGTYCVGFTNSGGDRSFVAEYTVIQSDVWEKKAVSVLASPSAGTWDYTTGIGINVRFALTAGTTFQTTAGAWQTGSFFATANQVNACDSTSNNFRVTGVQLEAGSVPSDFEQRFYQDELNLCMRYYKLLTMSVLGYSVSGTNVGLNYMFATPMRATPTMATSTYGNTTAGSDTVDTVSATGFRFFATTSGTGGYDVGYAGSASAEL